MLDRRIIREHGGEIDIESREGRGTKVSLFLPLVEKRVRLLGAGNSDSAAKSQQPSPPSLTQ